MKQNKFILGCVVITLSLCISMATLTVLEPEKLKLEFPNGIVYSISNFGKIPYGTRHISDLLLADPLEACTELKPLPNKDDKPFLLIKRGSCTFVTKVKNAEAAGA